MKWDENTWDMGVGGGEGVREGALSSSVLRSGRLGGVGEMRGELGESGIPEAK